MGMYNEDMRIGYNIGCQRLNEEIDTMIDEVHGAYMRSADENAKNRLDAQMKILWNFKDRIENAILDVEQALADKGGCKKSWEIKAVVINS